MRRGRIGFTRWISSETRLYTKCARIERFDFIGLAFERKQVPRLTAIISIRIFLNARRKYKTYQHLRRRRIPLIVTHLLVVCPVYNFTEQPASFSPWAGWIRV